MTNVENYDRRSPTGEARAAFGAYLRSLRAAKFSSRRAFAASINADFSYYSRIERGDAPPPAREALFVIASALGVGHDDARWQHLQDLAAIARGMLPDDLLADPVFVSGLPALFAYVRANRVAGTDAMYKAAYLAQLGGSPRLVDEVDSVRLGASGWLQLARAHAARRSNNRRQGRDG